MNHYFEIELTDVKTGHIWYESQDKDLMSHQFFHFGPAEGFHSCKLSIVSNIPTLAMVERIETNAMIINGIKSI